MAASRAKGRGGWDDPKRCTVENLAAMLCQHVGKGDPVDIANFAMMIHQRGGNSMDVSEALGVYMKQNQAYALTPEELDMEVSAVIHVAHLAGAA